MNTFFKRTTVVIVCLAAFATGTKALTTRDLLALELALDDSSSPNELRSLGPVRSYMYKLKLAGRHCKVESYEYGGLIVCEEPQTPSVLIDLSAEPTKAPELARVISIRPNGVDGGELPIAAFARFLAEFAGEPHSP